MLRLSFRSSRTDREQSGTNNQDTRSTAATYSILGWYYEDTYESAVSPAEL